MKFLKGQLGRFYPFTAIDEATRYRILSRRAHNSVKSAMDIVEELHRCLSVAVQRIKTGHHGAACGTDFTWHLHDLGTAHRYVPRGSPESNGRVERSPRSDAEEVSHRVTFRTLDELQAKRRQWEHEYNQYRPHLALKGKPPAERLCVLRIRVPHAVHRAA